MKVQTQDTELLPTYINIIVAVTFTEGAELIILPIAIAVDLQIAKLGSNLGGRHGSRLGSYRRRDIVNNVGSIGRAVIIEFIDVRSTLSAARAGTGISQAHLIARVLAVGLGGVGVAKMIDA